jgi:hypothetical protein
MEGKASEFQVATGTFSRALLLERAPILFAAEVPLFESEMDDNGVSACIVRVRSLHQLEMMQLLSTIVLSFTCGGHVFDVAQQMPP